MFFLSMQVHPFFKKPVVIDMSFPKFYDNEIVDAMRIPFTIETAAVKRRTTTMTTTTTTTTTTTVSTMTERRTTPQRSCNDPAREVIPLDVITSLSKIVDQDDDDIPLKPLGAKRPKKDVPAEKKRRRLSSTTQEESNDGIRILLDAVAKDEEMCRARKPVRSKVVIGSAQYLYWTFVLKIPKNREWSLVVKSLLAVSTHSSKDLANSVIMTYEKDDESGDAYLQGIICFNRTFSINQTEKWFDTQLGITPQCRRVCDYHGCVAYLEGGGVFEDWITGTIKVRPCVPSDRLFRAGNFSRRKPPVRFDVIEEDAPPTPSDDTPPAADTPVVSERAYMSALICISSDEEEEEVVAVEKDIKPAPATLELPSQDACPPVCSSS